MRLLEQEVAEAAEARVQMQRRLAGAAAEAAADADPVRARAAAAEAQRDEALQKLQLERHRCVMSDQLHHWGPPVPLMAHAHGGGVPSQPLQQLHHKMRDPPQHLQLQQVPMLQAHSRQTETRCHG